MSIFSSTRERRLWLALAIVLAAIYATLGQAPAIVAALGASILDNIGSNLVFAIIALLVVIPVFFIDKRLSRQEIAVGGGILTVYLLAWLRLGSWEERTHLFEYALVAALVHEALLERRDKGRRVPAPALLALILSIGLGWLDEGIQSLLPNRFFELIDVAFNSIAATMIIGARWVVARVRRWLQSRRGAQHSPSP
ncbi:MAG: VanZ family protein [Chloroflexi bacterium]|nr:VanZ family protein [Chloroflexota bacterium]